MRRVARRAAGVLGHATAPMTMDRYGHMVDANLWRAARLIGGFSGQLSRPGNRSKTTVTPIQAKEPGSERFPGRAAYRNRTDDLRITRVFSCVARGFKARLSFMFAGCCWWRSLAVDGSSGTSRNTLQYSADAVACSGDQSVHLPDHELLGRQIEPGGGLPMRLPLLTHHLSK